jgi:hypothetical protein
MVSSTILLSLESIASCPEINRNLTALLTAVCGLEASNRFAGRHEIGASQLDIFNRKPFKKNSE